MRTSHLFLGILLAGCGAAQSQTNAAAAAREARACSGISQEQAQGPFFAHHDEIVAVEPIPAPSDLPIPARDMGARTIFSARRGETPQLVERELACELARDAALGRPERGTEQFPESLPLVDVRVAPVAGGFAVDVTTTNADDAGEVLRRARALAGH